MCQQPGSGTGGKTSSQRLGEVGERQSQLNRRSREVARRLTQQMSLAEADQGEMRRLAEEQARIREQLEEIRRDEEARKSLLGGLDQAKKDMEQAEERLRQGRMDDELEAQQTNILSRLLDASRSMNRRDFDPEREARRGEDVRHESAAPLSRELFRTNDRLRQDLLKADADRVPARYRALIEAYLRSLSEAPR
jgi:chromosome segregation ATPase